MRMSVGDGPGWEDFVGRVVLYVCFETFVRQTLLWNESVVHESVMLLKMTTNFYAVI